MTNPDTDTVSFIRIAFAFIVVFGLITLLGLVLKYVQMRGLTVPGVAGRTRRLQVVESLALDARRRLVIARCDDAEHLLLLGAQQDIVVDANLKKNAGALETKSRP